MDMAGNNSGADMGMEKYWEDQVSEGEMWRNSPGSLF